MTPGRPVRQGEHTALQGATAPSGDGVALALRLPEPAGVAPPPPGRGHSGCGGGEAPIISQM